MFKVYLVGTLNMCLKVPEQMQKTRNQFDHPRPRKFASVKDCPRNTFFKVWSKLGQ